MRFLGLTFFARSFLGGGLRRDLFLPLLSLDGCHRGQFFLNELYMSVQG